MLLGTSKQNITPTEAVELAGFAHRKGKVDAVLEKLYVKSYLLQFEQKSFLLLAADLIWWDTLQVKELQGDIESKFGIPSDQICFHATHNHSGPQISYRFSKELGNPSAKYLDFLKQQVMKSIDQAFSNMESVDIKVNKGNAKIGVNRRKIVNGEIEMAPNMDGPIDNDLTVFSFLNGKNENKAIWIHYTCHPTSTDAAIISSEYPGVCCKKVSEQYPECNVAFLQGFCGDIRPAVIKENSFYWGNIEDMTSIGEGLSNEVIKLLQSDGELSQPVSFEFKKIEMPLTFSNEFMSMCIPKSLEEEWPTLIEKNNGNYELIIQYIKLGNKLKLFSCNAELVQEYGKYIKEKNDTIIPLGYSNGMVGYIPTSKQLEEGGYEAEESLFYFGFPAKLSSSTETEIKQKIDFLLGGTL